MGEQAVPGSGRVSVRLAGAADLPVVTRLRRAWVEEREGPVDDPGFEARFAAWAAREEAARRTWLVSFDGRPVGMANVLVFERMPSPGRSAMRWGYVGNVFVLAEHRNRGTGRRLIDEVVAWARAEDLERLVLNPSARSVPFYRRLGFGDSGLLRLDLPGGGAR